MKASCGPSSSTKDTQKPPPLPPPCGDNVKRLSDKLMIHAMKNNLLQSSYKTLSGFEGVDAFVFRFAIRVKYHPLWKQHRFLCYLCCEEICNKSYDATFTAKEILQHLEKECTGNPDKREVENINRVEILKKSIDEGLDAKEWGDDIISLFS